MGKKPSFFRRFKKFLKEDNWDLKLGFFGAIFRTWENKKFFLEK